VNVQACAVIGAVFGALLVLSAAPVRESSAAGPATVSRNGAAKVIAGRIDGPWGIVAGSDGALWFTNHGNGSIGRITTKGVVSTYVYGGIRRPTGIAVGPDGELWFANGPDGAGSIGRITTRGRVTIYKIAGAKSPQGIAVGPDGALWFTSSPPSSETTNPPRGSIGRITTGGFVTMFKRPAIRGACGITRGSDGALWFTNDGGRAVGRITTQGRVISRTVSPVMVGYCGTSQGIAAGPDGALWFTNAGRGDSTIGRMTTGGRLTVFSPSELAHQAPDEITAGPDGALWFTTADWGCGRLLTCVGHIIGRITTSGAVAVYKSAGIQSAHGIAAGPDGSLWFANGKHSIGRITTDGAIRIYKGHA
jgi:virginiamycin B lyase